MDFKIETYRFPLGMPDDLGNGLIHHCHALPDGESNFPAQIKRDFLALIFNRGKTISYNIGGQLPGTLSKRHYILAYIPQGHCELKMDTGKHSLFCIEITAPWQNKLKLMFPSFADFLVKATCPSQPLVSEPYRTTPRVYAEIEFTLHNDIPGVAAELLMGVKYMLISMECLRQIETFDSEEDGIDKMDLDKIQEAYEYLKKNIRFRCTINELADRVDISTKKLENAFKRIYGQTVYKALTQERLNRSMAYLRDTNLPLNEIAALVGYKDADTFCSTFKRNFGFSPGEVRKKGYGDNGQDTDGEENDELK